MNEKILVLEDDRKLSVEIQKYFISRGYECDIACDGAIFLEQKNTINYDIYILDINVPSINGVEVCRRIRATDKATAILMLTAFGEISDKVEALKSGADDYIVKPFNFDELLARVSALLRRSAIPQNADDLILIEDLEINFANLTVTRGDKPVNLTPKEFKLLELLAKAKGRPISKQKISEQIWDGNFEACLTTIGVYINFLRNKIDKEHQIKLIHTKAGFGYYLKRN